MFVDIIVYTYVVIFAILYGVTNTKLTAFVQKYLPFR